MALLHRKTAQPKPTAATESFRTPSLAEVSPEYAALIGRQAELNDTLRSLEREASTLRQEIAADTTPNVRPGVAVLLGDPVVDAKAGRIKRLGEIRRSISDHEIAIETVRRRIATAKVPASALVRAASKTEYARRVAAVCVALEAVQAARRDYEELRFAFEAEDVAWTALVPLGLGFLGDFVAGRSAHVDRVLKDSREAGYYGA